VTIYLPRHLEAASKPAEADVLAACHPQTSAVVLVVEDEPDVRMVVVDMLEDIGYTVLAAADGASGLKILDSETRVDLLVSDVGLPGGINGRQLADAARQRRSDLKVLFITGYSEVFMASSGLLGEGMQVITKPFSLTAFADKAWSVNPQPEAPKSGTHLLVEAISTKIFLCAALRTGKLKICVYADIGIMQSVFSLAARRPARPRHAAAAGLCAQSFTA